MFSFTGGGIRLFNISFSSSGVIFVELQYSKLLIEFAIDLLYCDTGDVILLAASTFALQYCVKAKVEPRASKVNVTSSGRNLMVIKDIVINL